MTPEERKEFIADIAAAIQLQVPVASFDADEVTALKLLIKKQEQSIKFRQAIIEKSTSALVWAAIVALGLIFREYAISHGMWKP
jgi:hypothetical protein